MATLVATSPPQLNMNGMNGMFAAGHAPPSPAYSPPPRPSSPLSLTPVDEPMPFAAPISAMPSTNTAVPVALTTVQKDALVAPVLRPAKHIAGFNSLLPPPVEFVEGSSSGTFAASLEGRYEPINKSPKAAPNGLSEMHTKAKPTSTKKTAHEEKTLPSLYTRPIDLSWPPNIVHGSGLFNQGNTCFLNSALQCLLHTPPLLRILLVHTKAECRVKSGFCMSCAMRQVMNDSFQKGRAFTPASITRNLNLIAKHLRRGRQEDAHEFLRYAIDALQKSCLAGYPPKMDPKLAETTWVHKLFGGRLRSRVTCQQCGFNSDTFDSILDLSIDIYNISGLKDALKKFTAKDYLKGADKYKCEKCKRPVNAEKQFTIHDAPAVLTVHLKRFTPTGRKLQHPVRYEERLSLQPAMSEGRYGPTYSLYGVISHIGGGPNSGHYFAHIRGADGQWYEMNDESVERARRPEPLNMKNAYILFYIREKGQALEAVVNGVGLVNGMATSKKRKSEDEHEGSDENEPAMNMTQPFIGPDIPSHLRLSRADPQSDVLKRKIEAAEREKQEKKRVVKAQRAGSRPLKPLVDYEDDSDEERGERVERSNTAVTKNNGIENGAPRGDSTLTPSSSPPSAPGHALLKDLNSYVYNRDRNEQDPSSPGPPPTSPLPSTSPAEAIAPSNFYGAPTPASSKRKSLDSEASDEDMNKDGDATETRHWKGRATAIAVPSTPRRSFGSSAGNPFGKSRIGDNLHAEREREERELFRPRKMHKRQFGSRHKFSF